MRPIADPPLHVALRSAAGALGALPLDARGRPAAAGRPPSHSLSP